MTLLIRAKLVPELYVSDLSMSLSFWVDLIGFRVAYDRPEEGFAYLDLDGSQIMLDQAIGTRRWLTGALESPFGRGINFQIDVPSCAAIIQRLEAAGVPLFMDVEDAWYRSGDIEVGQRQFLVQDPDGYLLRLGEEIGQRPARAAVSSPGP